MGLRTGLLRESMVMALSSLWTHKLRAILTILGVVIGITTVVGMVSLVQGLNRSMARQIRSLGTSVVYVRKFEPGLFVGSLPESLRHRRDFSVEDAVAIERLCPSVKAAVPLNFTAVPLKYRDRETRLTQVLGSAPDYLEIHELGISSGRCFTEEEVLHSADVCVMGQELLETLFPHTSSVGRWVSIGGKRFLIVGELEKRGNFLGQSLDDFVIMPHSTLGKRFGPDLQIFVDAKPVTVEATEQAIEEITELMRRRRGIPANRGEDFAVFTEDVLMDLYHRITGTFYIVMIAISSIALMVGGVGVTNIMFVSVTERTREIGLRMAVGARRTDVMVQFLTEAVVLTATGGVIGIAIGVFIGWLVEKLVHIPSAAPFWSLALGFAFSSAVGLFFGMYPAVKASRLDPVVALRYE
ncbi:MAG: ABC transporter permease [Candidatus Eiseniibacteriota bacterium]|nr:MAG: ABC transporter permease [Candidatus Eisenbacteria bacterium]